MRKNILYALVSFLICWIQFGFAQTGTFIKQIGGIGIDSGRDFAMCSNGDYLLIGVTTSYSVSGDSDIYILRMTPQGDTISHKIIGGPGSEDVRTVIKTSDGNFVLAGGTRSYGAGKMDIYLLKINESGTLIWSKTYGTPNDDGAYDVKETADGNLIVSGSIHTNDPIYPDAFLMKVDQSGNQLWIKTYGGNEADEAASVCQTDDGGFIMAGHTSSNEVDHSLCYIIRTNSLGDTLWTRKYGQGGLDEGHSITKASDGGYVIVSDQEKSFTSGDFDVCVRKYNDSGTMIWNKVYGGDKKDVVKSIHSCTDGGYIVGAISRSFGYKNPHFWILKLNVSGDTTWTKFYGGLLHQHCYNVHQTPDGGYLALGHTESNPTKNLNMYIVKMDNTGYAVATGINNNTALQNKFISIYPNPLTSVLYLHSETKLLGLEIFNQLGAMVYRRSSVQMGGFTDRIDLNLPSGIYFVKMTGENNLLQTEKIIVEKQL